MNIRTIPLGAVMFAVVRPLFVAFTSLFGVSASTAENVLVRQSLLGLLTGLVTIPIALVSFKAKWPRVVVCAIVCSIYGCGLVLIGTVNHPLDSQIIVGALGLVFVAWTLCGVFASWLTFTLMEYYEGTKKSATN